MVRIETLKAALFYFLFFIYFFDGISACFGGYRRYLR